MSQSPASNVPIISLSPFKEFEVEGWRGGGG